VIGAHLLAVVEHAGGVEDVVALVDVADHGRDATALTGDVLEGLQVRLDERRLEQQIFRRISGEDQLRERHDVRLPRPRASHPVDDHPRVVLDRTHRRIDLGESDAHASHTRILV